MLLWHLTGTLLGIVSSGIAMIASVLMEEVSGDTAFRGWGLLWMPGALIMMISGSLFCIPFLFGWLAVARRFPRLERDPGMRLGVLAGLATVVIGAPLYRYMPLWPTFLLSLGWLVGPRLLVRSLRGSLVRTRPTPRDHA